MALKALRACLSYEQLYPQNLARCLAHSKCLHTGCLSAWMARALQESSGEGLTLARRFSWSFRKHLGQCLWNKAWVWGKWRICKTEVEMIQGTLGGTCPRRKARGTRVLQVESNSPTLTRDTNVPNKRAFSLCHQTTKAPKFPYGPVQTLPSQNKSESRMEMTCRNAMLRFSTAWRGRAQALALACLGSNPGSVT